MKKLYVCIISVMLMISFVVPVYSLNLNEGYINDRLLLKKNEKILDIDIWNS